MLTFSEKWTEMPKISAIVAGIILFFDFSFAISVNDIAPIYISSDEIGNLRSTISLKIEPFAQNWSKEWTYQIPKKDVEKEIVSALDLLNSRIWADDVFTLNFLEALLWHYYYQLENENGYFECDKITKKMQKNFPHKIEPFWLNGINKIKAGRVAEGFKILDSLYTNSNVSSSFINEYSQASKICFIPQNHNNNIFTLGGKQDEFYFAPKELKPALSQWESNETDGIVSFVFTEQYWFVENLQLPYPKLYNAEDWKFPIEIDSLFLKDMKQEIIWRPDRAVLHPVAYKITIDRSPQKISLMEYMFSLVYNRFDYVEEIKPPLRAGGISARSGQYNVIRGVSGKSIIYTLFDCTTNGNVEQFFTTPNTLKGVKEFNTRILIALETTQKIEDKAMDFYIDIINGNFSW